MAGLINRRPLVGIAAGGLFGSLGYLLIGVDGATVLARSLFLISGYFFLFVAVLSLLAAVYALLHGLRSR